MRHPLAAVRSAFARRGLGLTPGYAEGPVAGAGRIILVGAGKHGVGASCTAAMLAMGVARDLGSTLLVDADHEAGVLHDLFGVRPPHPLRALRAGDVTPREYCLRLGPGLDLLAPAHDHADAAALAPAEHRQLMRDCATVYDQYRAVFVDVGHRFEVIRAMTQLGAQQFVAVTTPDAVSVASAYALIKAVYALAPDLRVSVLLTRAEEPQAQRIYAHLDAGVQRFLPTAIGLAGIVPDDPSLQRGMRSGMTLPEACDGSPAQGVLRGVARVLVGLDRPAFALPEPGAPTPSAPFDTRF